MCGIVGVAGDLWSREEGLMRRLLLADWIRGPDSTGLAAVRLNGEVNIAKVADHPLVLFDTGRFKTTLNGNMSKVFLGHNRAATRGRINHANTHPFEVGDIIGVHNGTIDYSCFEALKKELGESFDVDSEAVMAAIDKWGLKDAIGRLEGSWSIVYYDRRDGTLNFIRNSERPMVYAYTKDFKKLFFASEATILDFAIKNTGNYDIFADDKGNEYFKTEENVHYRFDVDAIKKGSDKVPKPKVKTVTGKEKETPKAGSNHGNFPLRPVNENSGTSGTRSQGTGTGTGSTKSANSAILRTTTGPRYNGGRDGLHQCVGTKDKPFGGFLSKSEWDNVMAGGNNGCCTYCDEPIAFGAVGVTVFERDWTVLCPRCSGNQRRNRFVVADRAKVPVVA